MRKYLIIVGILLGIACQDKGSSTSPSRVDLLPSPTSSPPPSNTTDGGDVAETGSFSGQGIQSFNDGSARGIVSLSGTESRDAYLAVYKFVTEGGSVQERVGMKHHEIAGGTTRQFFVPFKVQCETTYQADFTHEVPPEMITNGVVPSLITPLTVTADKWTSGKCPVTGCQLGEFGLDVDLDVGEEDVCVTVIAPARGTFSSEGHGSKSGRSATFCFDREQEERTVFIDWKNSDGCEARAVARIRRLPTCEEQYPPDFTINGPTVTKDEENCTTIFQRSGKRKFVEAVGSVDFITEGGIAILRASGTEKDRGSVQLSCSETGTVNLSRKFTGFCSAIPELRTNPAHWNSTWAIEVQ